jgi:hypothetical protein
MTLRLLPIAAAAAAAAGCGSSQTPSREQDRELNAASRMLDEAPNSLDQVEESGLANASDEPGSER